MVKEHQHAEVQSDMGAGYEHVLVAGGAGDCAHVTNVSTSEYEHQLTGVQPDGDAGEDQQLQGQEAQAGTSNYRDKKHMHMLDSAVDQWEYVAKVLDRVLKNKYSIEGKQLDNWLQLEMGSKPCLERLPELEEITVGFLMEGSRCDSKTWDSWEMRQGQGARKEVWSVSQI